MPPKSKKPPVNTDFLPPVPANQPLEADIEHDARSLLSTPPQSPLDAFHLLVAPDIWETLKTNTNNYYYADTGGSAGANTELQSTSCTLPATY